MKDTAHRSNTHGLDEKSLGHICHMVNLANQIPGDWSDMGPYDPTQEGDDAYRYQLAYMVYALGLAQYHRTPAYRELYRDTMAKLIEKMMRWEVWGYWELASRGSKVIDPDLTELVEGWIDPVLRQNIMYSGHLLMMVSLYEMLYQDGRYAAEGALTFQFRPVLRGLGPADFPYDHGKLAQAIFNEFERNQFIGCECEPNGIFVNCNQFPLLGFMHYDHMHGTDFAARTMPKFREQWRRRSTLFSSDHEADLPVFYRVRQGDMVYEDSQANNESINATSWGSVMHAWEKDYVEMVYPVGRDRTLRRMPDGSLGVQMAGDHQKHKDYQRNPGHHSVDPMMLGVHLFGTLALAAAEVGDEETLTGMLRYADTYMKPTWKNGGLYYPRNDDLGSDAYTTARVGNALIAGARLCPRDGFWEMYNRAWTKDDLHTPQLCDVAHPDILVSQADYEREVACLVMTLKPGLENVGPHTFSVCGLDLSQPLQVEVDDLASIEINPCDGCIESGDIRIRVDFSTQKLKLSMELSKERRVIVRSANSTMVQARRQY